MGNVNPLTIVLVALFALVESSPIYINEPVTIRPAACSQIYYVVCKNPKLVARCGFEENCKRYYAVPVCQQDASFLCNSVEHTLHCNAVSYCTHWLDPQITVEHVRNLP